MTTSYRSLFFILIINDVVLDWLGYRIDDIPHQEKYGFAVAPMPGCGLMITALQEEDDNMAVGRDEDADEEN